MAYQIKKTLTGGYSVKFECPTCKVRLNAPLSDAGRHDVCPQCGNRFEIPGTKELSAQEAFADEEARKKEEEKLEQDRLLIARAKAEQLQRQQDAAKEQAAKEQAAKEQEQEVEEDSVLVPLAAPLNRRRVANGALASQDRQNRYPLLCTWVAFLRIIGYVLIGIGVIAFIGILMTRKFDQGTEPFFAGLFAFVSFAVPGASCAILGELITVLLDIESNTRRDRDHTTRE